MRSSQLAGLLAATAAVLSASARAQAQGSAEDPLIIVIAPGGEFDVDDALVFGSAEVIRDGSPDLLAALARNAPALTLADATTNPFQPNIVYRGFAASPLQGSAQGLAAYVDGTRFNLPFGDTVDLSLLPEVAIERVKVKDASPVYGLNALGGTLVIATKTGRSAEGVGLSLAGGNYGAVEGSIEAGWQQGGWSAYAAFEADHEDGWRRFSPSTRYAALGDLGYDSGSAGAHIKLAYADTDLTGNGAAPIELLEADRRAVFTVPDNSRNELLRVSVHPYVDLSERTRLEASLYYLDFHQRTLNGDAAEIEACEEEPGVLCLEAGDEEEELIDSTGEEIADVLGGEGYGVVNRSRTRTDAGGALVQLVDRRPMLSGENELVVGFSYDRSRTRFRSSTELGELTEIRSVAGLGPIIAQPSGVITPVELVATTRYTGVFVAERLPLTPALTLEIGLRWNRARVRLEDQLGEALNGDHRFSRLNPGVELDWAAADWLTLRAGYAETNRAPTPAELSCADEDAPCSLANFFVGDPPLEQVVARSWELGASGNTQSGGWRLDYLLSAYRATNADDIQFVASDVRGRAFFRNVGSTRRQGVEATLSAARGPWSLRAGYALSDATFRDAFVLGSGANPEADAEGNITVSPGDRIPSVPRHRGLVSVDYDGPRFSLGADLQAQSGVGYVGDEIGAVGTTGSYAVVDLRASARIAGPLSAFVSVRNLFGTDYESFGILSEADEVELPEAPGIEDPRFVGPGQPRRIRVGVRAAF